MIISIIVAVAENGAIGKDNQLLWHLPGDLKLFKKLTTGHAVIMGRKTWESLSVKPLPGRLNVVLSSNPGYDAPGAVVVQDTEEAIRVCDEQSEVFIIGGASVYAMFLPRAHRLYITRVHRSYEADVFFPSVAMDEWGEVSSESHESSDQGLAWTFSVYHRFGIVK
jgi:dihydrofolate reductase